MTDYYPTPWDQGTTGANRYWQPYVNGTDPSWDQWTATGITITHTASTTVTAEAWDDWTAHRQFQIANTTYPVWDEWNRTGTLHTLNSRKWARQGTARKPLELTAKQLHEQARQKAIRERRVQVAGLRKRIAERRAEALLLAELSAEQREQWVKDRAFTIETADGRRCYRIREGLAGNVYLVRDDDAPGIHRGAYLKRYCFHVYHPDGRVPLADNVLAQKLVLECNEQFFLEEANVG